MALLSGVTSAVPMQTIRKCCHRWQNLVWNMQSFKQFSYYWLCEPTFLKIILSVIITLWEDITQLNKIWCQIHGSFCHLWQHQLVVCTRTVKLLSPPMVVPSMWPNAETKVNPCHWSMDWSYYVVQHFSWWVVWITRILIRASSCNQIRMFSPLEEGWYLIR